MKLEPNHELHQFLGNNLLLSLAFLNTNPYTTLEQFSYFPHTAGDDEQVTQL